MVSAALTTQTIVGGYQLLEVIGRGGMGVIWDAKAIGTSATAAIKVVNREFGVDTIACAEFRREVRAVARLRHPNIVRVYDHGVITEDAEWHSGGQLVNGSPWLAMERAEFSLVQCRSGMDWGGIRQALLEILSALAHAHARGVIHRDIKPGNVLRRADGSWLLADFGIAYAMASEEHAVDREVVAGTPSYMAPEQAQNSTRELGPWTDLYALACVAYAMVTGTPPFYDQNPMAMLEKHATDPLPPLRPHIAVPYGLDGWLARCLAKDPEYRYRRASDAARDLVALTGSEPGDPMGMNRTIFDEETVQLHSTTQTTGTASLGSRSDTTASAVAVVAPTVGRVPDSRGDDPPQHRWQAPVGLGLFELIEFSPVAREPERDALWGALCRAQEHSSAQAVILEGPSGLGKTFLMEWLAQRADELGCAEVFRARHGPVGGPGDGIGAMLARHLRCAGLSESHALSHLIEVLRKDGDQTPLDPFAVHALITPWSSETTAPVTTAEDRHETAREIIYRGARGRVPIVLIDDAHWGPEGLDLAKHLLQHPENDQPALIIIGARRDWAVCDEEIGRSIDSLAALPTVTRLPIGPMSQPDSVKLIRDVVGIAPSLAITICERAAGNPAHGLGLVRELYRRGSLALGPTGLIAVEGAMKELPLGGAAVWSATVERLLKGWSRSKALSLELAAALGTAVTSSEWEAVCHAAGVVAAWDLVDQMTESGLVIPSEPDTTPGWSFSQILVRESLVARARGADRWVAHNRACAVALSDQRILVSPERRGRHLLEAEQLEPAIDLLLEAAVAHHAGGHMGSVAALMAIRDRALSDLGANKADVRWVTGWILWARALLVTGALDEVDRLMERAILCGRVGDHGGHLSEALSLRAHVLRLLGEPKPAMELAAEARAIANSLGDGRRLALAERAYARICMQSGETKMAERFFRSAYEWDVRRGDPRGAASSAQGIAAVFRRRVEHDQARLWTERARALFSDAGNRWGMGACDNDLGEIARAQGHLEEARTLYARARDTHRAIGSWESHVDEVNLGLVHLEMGKPLVARQILLRTLVRFEQLGNRAFAGAVHGMLIGCAAALEDWDAAQVHLARAEEELEVTGQSWQDVALLTKDAGKRALEAGKLDLAQAVLTLSLKHWEELDSLEESQQVRDELLHLQQMTDSQEDHHH
jgi:serine/threonine protein kinase/tetratricopeptide (TPR) repeat protein